MDKRILHHLEECDQIWHAGDIGDISIIDTLEELKPLRAVYGNIDGAEFRRALPEDLRFRCEEVDVRITHIGGRPPRYDRFVRDSLLQNSPDLFICGHSHILKVEFDKKLQMLYMNPGAAGKHGFHKVRTMLRFNINGKKIEDLEVIELGPRASLPESV